MQPQLSVGWSECSQSGQNVLTLFREFRVNLQDKTVPGFHFAETEMNIAFKIYNPVTWKKPVAFSRTFLESDQFRLLRDSSVAES